MASAEPMDGRCAAKVGSRFCEKYPMAGQRRCGTHGGRAPQAVAAAERRQQEQAAIAAMVKYGVPQSIQWHEALQEGLDETYGNVLYLRDLVQRLAPEALTWGKSQVVEVGSGQFPGIDITQAAGIAPVVQLYGQERDRLHRMAHDCGRLGLEARRTAVAERDAQHVVEVMRGSLLRLDEMLAAGVITSVDPSLPEVQSVLSTQLRALTGGAA